MEERREGRRDDGGRGGAEVVMDTDTHTVTDRYKHRHKHRHKQRFCDGFMQMYACTHMHNNISMYMFIHMYIFLH